jgi:hypothetical protein
VGGPNDNSDTGAAWVFTRSGGVWTQQGNKLVGNGLTGAAWVFTRSGGVWTQQGSKLAGTGAVGAASQGTSIALSADGNTAIVGGWPDNGETGAAWVFTRSGGVWTQQSSKLVGTGAVGGARQGFSAALSGAGDDIVASINAGLDQAGAGIIVFSRHSKESRWVEAEALRPRTDGNTAFVGGPFDSR